MLGLPRGTVALLPHDPAWPALAQATCADLRRILSPLRPAAEHVGSTAVPAIRAKPILDIAVGVDALADVEAFVPALAAAGYQLRPSTHAVDELLFACGPESGRTHHVHVIRRDGEEFANYLNFRDYLNLHPDAARAYEALKMRLCAEFSADRGAYTGGKHAFITEMLERARAWRAGFDAFDGRSGKWAAELIASQLPDGSWGRFHSMSTASGSQMTTERALRRLETLGFDDADPVVARAVDYLEGCLAAHAIPDPTEKGNHWDVYVDLMLAAWIRRFRTSCADANAVAQTWADIITHAFASGTYDHDRYMAAYEASFGRKPRGGRLVDFVQFYIVSLLTGALDEATQRRMVDYILAHPEGIYYICEAPLKPPPETLASRAGHRWLTAMELLARYPAARDELKFAADYLYANQAAPGIWDLGAAAKDGVYFPIADRWDIRSRREDCTRRVRRVLERIG